MAERRPAGRNPFRPGTASYARLREADLKRRAALGKGNAARAMTPEARSRAKEQVSAAQRALRAVEGRTAYRSQLTENTRREFDKLSIKQQEVYRRVARTFPDRIPPDVPDPFSGPNRSSGWRLYYATRTGGRHR